ncbi:unnamed protein product [Rotaria socialis]|uniref:Fatty acid hydroxylase domain-containing protein n=2 Tax=Rotaria socialis TaxID=392032 RepID=A0A821AJR7_9BILA|nr:unnamed protein product [Rotaria socialis]
MLGFEINAFSDPILISIGTFAIHQATFWIYNGLLLLYTNVLFPKQAYRFKIQKNIDVDAKSLKLCVKTVLFNQVFIMLPALILTYPLLMRRGILWHRPLPPWYQILFELAGFIITTEVVFYYSHLFLHLPVIYERVHKQHHYFRAPIGIVSEYSHPIEFIVSSMTSVIAGPVLFRSHLLTTWIWLLIAVAGTINHHCGYLIPGILSTGLANPSFHDFHHSQFTANFGLLGILDRLHGTDKAWRAHKQKTEKQ